MMKNVDINPKWNGRDSDKCNEKLVGKEALQAIANCFNCKNLKPCSNNNWVNTCDKDGKTCDNYDPIKRTN